MTSSDLYQNMKKSQKPQLCDNLGPQRVIKPIQQKNTHNPKQKLVFFDSAYTSTESDDEYDGTSYDDSYGGRLQERHGIKHIVQSTRVRDIF